MFGRCPRWSTGRALLLGDAAHPMSPVRAQGINLALRDAIVAANHLVPALAAGDAAKLLSAGERIQSEREPEIELSQNLQLSAAEVPPPARTPFLRATVLPLMRVLGLLKRSMLATEMKMRHGVTSVKLSV